MNLPPHKTAPATQAKWLFGAAVWLGLVGCSSGGGGAPAAQSRGLFVAGCSLGCSDGADGAAVACTVTTAYRNGEIAVLFSEPVDLGSVNSESFRVRRVDDDSTALGEYALDPLDARRVVFRPALLFGPAGDPQFGFEDSSYRVVVPGSSQGDSPPFVRSQAGEDNRSRMDCVVAMSLGIEDPVAGAPRAAVEVSQVQAGGGTDTVRVSDDPGATTNVSADSTIALLFNEVIDVASALQPGQVELFVDFDGGLGDQRRSRSDRGPAEFQRRLGSARHKPRLHTALGVTQRWFSDRATALQCAGCDCGRGR